MLDFIFQSFAVIRPLVGDSSFVFSLLIGLMFGLFVLACIYVASIKVDPVRRRVAEGGYTESNSSSLARQIVNIFSPVKNAMVPTNEKELSGIQTRLTHAGYRSNDAVLIFYAIKLISIVFFAVIGLCLAYLLFKGSTVQSWMLGGLFALFGMLLPSHILDRRVQKRQSEIINGFPDVLDLMVACTEAGLGLNDAIQRVANESHTIYPILGEELDTVNSEIRAGKDRVEALRALANRTGVDTLAGFVAMLTQSIRFGTSIADTMRIYAEEFRDKRMQAAEEQAAKVGTKLIFPLVFCIFPSFFIVAIGPSVITIMRVFESLN